MRFCHVQIDTNAQGSQIAKGSLSARRCVMCGTVRGRVVLHVVGSMSMRIRPLAILSSADELYRVDVIPLLQP
jgi:hypothetical protein